MKRTKLFAIAIIAGSIVMASCGGSGENSNEENMNDTTAIQEEAAITEHSIDVAASTINWKGTMLGVKSHHGLIDFQSGNISLKGNQVIGGDFTVDMNSIHPKDSNYNEDYTKDGLIGHLKTHEFFDVENHPSASFAIDSAYGGSVYGTLTIRGNSHPEKVTNVTVTEDENGRKVMSGDLIFDRHQYNVSWDNPVKEMVLSNDIELKINLVTSN